MTEFHGKIRVAARVIDFLSSGLYQSPGSCLKELVNNSYDADATRVIISVKPDADFVAIEDDGTGMTRKAFEKHFANVAESHKRDDGERTPAGRYKIGKIGIGFIAANELCDEMEIYSTCKGSTELLHVTINFGDIRNRPFKERRAEGGSVEKADYHGEMLDAEADVHFTKVYLKQLRPVAREALVSPHPLIDNMPKLTLYGKKPGSARDQIAALGAFNDMDAYSQTRTDVALNVPVAYAPRWAPARHVDMLEPFTKRAASLDFKVIYDGVELQKPIVLSDNGDESICERVQFSGEHISVDGYLFARHGALKPVDLNGVLIRIRESAVGDYDRGLLGFPNTVHQLFQNWVSGELYVDGLEDALNIDRRTLREVEASYMELRNWFKETLDDFLKRVNRELYSTRSRERGAKRAQSQADEVQRISASVRKQLGGAAADAISGAIAKRSGSRPVSTSAKSHAREQPPKGDEPVFDAPTLRLLNKKFTVSQILELVVEAASAALSPEHATKFIAEFTRRLRG
jgi:hypothetical protein